MQCDKEVTNWSYLVARKSQWDVYGGDISFVLQWSYCLTAGSNSQLVVWAQMFIPVKYVPVMFSIQVRRQFNPEKFARICFSVVFKWRHVYWFPRFQTDAIWKCDVNVQVQVQLDVGFCQKHTVLRGSRTNPIHMEIKTSVHQPPASTAPGKTLGRCWCSEHHQTSAASPIFYIRKNKKRAAAGDPDSK